MTFAIGQHARGQPLPEGYAIIDWPHEVKAKPDLRKHAELILVLMRLLSAAAGRSDEIVSFECHAEHRRQMQVVTKRMVAIRRKVAGQLKHESTRKRLLECRQQSGRPGYAAALMALSEAGFEIDPNSEPNVPSDVKDAIINALFDVQKCAVAFVNTNRSASRRDEQALRDSTDRLCVVAQGALGS